MFCEPADFLALQSELADLEASGEVRYLPKPESEITLTDDAAISVAKLWAKLDEHDDVQKVYVNASLPDEVLEEYGP